MAREPLSEVLRHRRGLLETLVVDRSGGPGSTLMPTLALDTRQIELAEVQLAPRGEIVMHEQTLGEGGMGVVRLGTQLALGREVAVKTARETASEPRIIAKLVQEAVVTGALEHPNIVPIYDLVRDDEGRPMLVMRRIDGVAWGTLIDDDPAIRARFGVTDPLDWNLRVLMQLASALHFAHGREIVHLDLKPDNVMIGPLGEVYLVDWGLAMTLADDPRLPRARDNTDVIGTPAFVAPEMLAGDGTRLGAHTDVYLLGSTLYSILAGRPPHDGENLYAVLFQALEGTPDPLPDQVAPELARIVARAMARSPRDRFPSADAFRLALQEFLEHRGALALVRRADQRAAQLERRLGDGAVDGVVAAASEARFGYSQALAAWSDCEAARVGLDRVTARYAVWCAERDELATAEGLATQLTEEHPELARAIEAARARIRAGAERLAELEELGRDYDAATGQRTRLLIVGLVVLLAGLVPIAAPFVPWLLSYQAVLLFPLVCALIMAGLAAWGSESVSATRINRGGVATMVVMMLGQFLITYSGYRAGLPVGTTMSLSFPLWALTASSLAGMVEWRLWPSAVGFGLGSAVVVFQPTWWLALIAICNLTAFLNLVWVWRPGRRRD